ncbi:MAG TPA: DUF1501 domain-containing protein [Pirellulales bacterium]|nr:DUF1501 domain-containing protein [Pirellulales bacterium]
MPATSLPAAWTRREILRAGGLSIMAGMGIKGARAATSAQTSSGDPERHCIFLLLQGGLSHIDLFDPKPQASEQIRGPFGAIETSVPGVRLGEMLPQTSKLMQHVALIRSMEHEFNNHIAGTYVTLTGSNDQRNEDREARGEDFPGPGAVLNWLQHSPAAVPVSVSLPNWLSIPGPSNRMPGQYGGFLGNLTDPFLISGDPSKPDFKPLNLALPEFVPLDRMQSRWQLRQQIDTATRHLENQLTQSHDRLRQSAYDLLIDPGFRDALDLSREPDAVRDRYGRTSLGQSLLLARRLIESGVRLVSYNAFNQAWDTHGHIQNTYKHRVPPLDQAYSALIEDLLARGMLDRTMVIQTGEFGRTPVINKEAGRDHWPSAYSCLVAGGGIRGGIVHGASDAKGAYVASQPVAPADLLATMWTHLGIAPATELRDRFDRPIVLSKGRVLRELL